MIFLRFLKRLLPALSAALIGLLLVFSLPRLPESARGIAGAVFTCGIVPVFTFTFVWAVWALLREFRISRVMGEPLPPARDCRLGRTLLAEGEDFRAMEGGERAAWILLHLAAPAVTAAGILLLWRENFAAGTPVLVAGAFLWVLAAPNRYNRPGRSAKVLPCPQDLSAEELCRALASTDTVLGRPYVSRLRFVRGKCVVFGPGEDGIFLYFRKNRSGRRLFLIRSGADALIRDPRPGAPEGAFDGDLDTLTLYLVTLTEDFIRRRQGKRARRG